MANQPFSYGIPDGDYIGQPVTASCFEKGNMLILDVRFQVKDPKTGEFYKKDNGYPWEASKRHWLTNKDGGFNEATIEGIKEWAKGWNPSTFNDFWWFQNPDANGTPFGNLLAIGDVSLNFKIDKTGNQQMWVHDINRPRARAAYVPDGGNADASALAAKWGAKAKALFSAQPKKIAAAPTPAPAPAPAPVAAPVRSTPPVRPAAAPAADAVAQDWANYPATGDGVFAYFCSKLSEPYASDKHDDKWFAIYDAASGGKDPDEFTDADTQRMFRAVYDAFSIG